MIVCWDAATGWAHIATGDAPPRFVGFIRLPRTNFDDVCRLFARTGWTITAKTRRPRMPDPRCLSLDGDTSSSQFHEIRIWRPTIPTT